MADAWNVYGGLREWERDPLYAEARARVLRSPRLRTHMAIILSDGYATDEDHLRWVIRGKVSGIVAWADQIRRDSDADG
jgi:hypothetical protein